LNSMTPEQIRDAKWTEIEKLVTGQREIVYNSLLACGRCTTSALAAKMERSVLSVRPRVSELYDLGLVALVGKEGHEGIYEAVTVFAARQAHEYRQAARVSQGMQLSLL
jgi:predicted transcriptional regulator